MVGKKIPWNLDLPGSTSCPGHMKIDTRPEGVMSHQPGRAKILQNLQTHSLGPAQPGDI